MCQQETHALQQRPRLLVDRDHNGSSHLSDSLREMSLPVYILDQNDLAGPNDASFSVTGCDFVGRIQVDDVLTSRRGMPIEKPIGGRRPQENSSGRGSFFRIVVRAYISL